MTKEKEHFKGFYKVQFGEHLERIKEMRDGGYPITEIWDTLKKEKKYSGTMRSFRYHCDLAFKGEKKKQEISRQQKPPDEPKRQHKPVVKASIERKAGTGKNDDKHVKASVERSTGTEKNEGKHVKAFTLTDHEEKYGAKNANNDKDELF